MTRVKYPRAPRTNLIEIHHGVPVADPFRTLENADDPATAAWVDKDAAELRDVIFMPVICPCISLLRYCLIRSSSFR